MKHVWSIAQIIGRDRSLPRLAFILFVRRKEKKNYIGIEALFVRNVARVMVTCKYLLELCFTLK